MKEASKAMRRRMADTSFPWREIFKGNILDVGSGNDPLIVEGQHVTHLDAPDDAGDDLSNFLQIGVERFNVIHGSQVLEHMNDPVVAMWSWIGRLHLGGYIVATVPDFVLYEKLEWPSRYNAGHRSTWSLTHKGSPAPIHCKLPEWLEQFPVRVLSCVLVDSNYDYSKPASVDQTFRYEAGVEAFCEFVIKRVR